MSVSSLQNSSGGSSTGIYTIVANVVPGAVSLTVVLLMLPRSVINISSVVSAFQTETLLDIVPWIGFAAASYLLGSVIKTLIENFPMQRTTSKLFYYSPLMPQAFVSEIDLGDNVRNRYNWACNHLFLDVDGPVQSIGGELITSETGSIASKRMAKTYLLHKGSTNIQRYDMLSNVFQQLEATFIMAMLFFTTTGYLSSVESIGKNQGLLTYMLQSNRLLLYVFVLIVVGCLFLFVASDYLPSWKWSQFLPLSIFYLMIVAVAGVALPVLFQNFSYSSNLSQLYDKNALVPIVVFFLSYMSRYQCNTNKRKMEKAVILELYPIAVAEGDIPKMDQKWNV